VTTVGVRGTVPKTNDESLQQLGVAGKRERDQAQARLAREAIRQSVGIIVHRSSSSSTASIITVSGQHPCPWPQSAPQLVPWSISRSRRIYYFRKFVYSYREVEGTEHYRQIVAYTFELAFVLALSMVLRNTSLQQHNPHNIPVRSTARSNR